MLSTCLKYKYKYKQFAVVLKLFVLLFQTCNDTAIFSTCLHIIHTKTFYILISLTHQSSKFPKCVIIADIVEVVL